MQEKFQYLIINKPDEYPNFIEDVSNLIFYSEIKKINSIGIIKNILNIYSENIIEQIYKKLIEKNIEYSEELTKLITNFFIKNIKKADISCLFYIIKNKKEQLEKSTISYLNQFSLTESDFFQIEENENLKLFIKLSKAEMIPNLTNCEYKKSCLSIKIKISQDLYSGNIKYKDISPFYLNNQKEILYNRILLLDNNNGEKENGIKNKVNEYMEKISIILEDLKLKFLDVK